MSCGVNAAIRLAGPAEGAEEATPVGSAAALTRGAAAVVVVAKKGEAGVAGAAAAAAADTRAGVCTACASGVSARTPVPSIKKSAETS